MSGCPVSYLTSVLREIFCILHLVSPGCAMNDHVRRVDSPTNKQATGVFHRFVNTRRVGYGLRCELGGLRSYHLQPGRWCRGAGIHSQLT